MDWIWCQMPKWDVKITTNGHWAKLKNGIASHRLNSFAIHIFVEMIIRFLCKANAGMESNRMEILLKCVENVSLFHFKPKWIQTVPSTTVQIKFIFSASISNGGNFENGWFSSLSNEEAKVLAPCQTIVKLKKQTFKCKIIGRTTANWCTHHLTMSQRNVYNWNWIMSGFWLFLCSLVRI